MFQSAIILGCFLQYLSAYSICNTADVKSPVTIPIIFKLEPQYTAVRLSGKIVINDGCTFSVSDLTYYNAGKSQFYGGVGDSVAEGITVSDDVINPATSGGSQTFKLRSVAGAQVSFRDFTQFRIYDTDNKVLIGVANVPSDLLARGSTGTGATGATGTTATTGSATAAVTLNAKSSSYQENGSMLSLALLFAYAFFLF